MFSDIPDEYRLTCGCTSGKVKKAFTITTRNKYTDMNEFRSELYKMLSNLNYTVCLDGVMEKHKQKGKNECVHAHGILYAGNVPKNNRKNEFYFKTENIKDEKGWINYCKKDVKTRKDPPKDVLCVFDEDD